MEPRTDPTRTRARREDGLIAAAEQASASWLAAVDQIACWARRSGVAARRLRTKRARAFVHLLGTLLVAVLMTDAALTAQRDEKPPPTANDDKWREDPYTGQDPDLILGAGYTRIDRITWTPDYGSDRIEQALGDVKIRWIETEHFRIGSELPTWKLAGESKEVRARIKKELERLKKKFPKVKPQAKELDPWLRAHLYAQRFEDLYAQLCGIVGATSPDAFPSEQGELVDGEDMGRGPHFGCRSKFGVLLLAKESSCARFLSTFTGAPSDGPSRWYMHEHDMFVFATATEYSDGVYTDDTRLYCHVLTYTAYNMIDGYRGFTHRPPIWWQEGLVHSLRREISEEHNDFSGVADASERIYAISDWAPRVAGAIEHEIYRPLRDIGTITDYESVKFAHHCELWSRVEFLRSLGDDKFGSFIKRMKGIKTANGEAPPIDYVLKTQADAIRDIWGYEDLDALDAAWIRWAKRAYRDK